LDGNEQQYFKNSWAMDKIMKKHMTGEWREFDRMAEKKCLIPSINPFSFPSLPRTWVMKTDTIMNAWNVSRQRGERKATLVAVTADEQSI
jgi:hypothetical protein